MNSREKKEIFTWEERKEKIVKEERIKCCCCQEDSQEGESKVLLPLKEIISVRERVKKNKKDFSLAVRHIQELL